MNDFPRSANSVTLCFTSLVLSWLTRTQVHFPRQNLEKWYSTLCLVEEESHRSSPCHFDSCLDNQDFSECCLQLGHKLINRVTWYKPISLMINMNMKYSRTFHKRPPKCQAQVVVYRRWSLARAYTMLGQNFASLAHGNCRLTPCFKFFINDRSQFRENIRHFSLTNFLSLISLFDNVSIPYYPIYPLLSVKWSLMGGGRLQEVPNIMIWLGNFWYFETWPKSEVWM